MRSERSERRFVCRCRIDYAVAPLSYAKLRFALDLESNVPSGAEGYGRPHWAGAKAATLALLADIALECQKRGCHPNQNDQRTQKHHIVPHGSFSENTDLAAAQVLLVNDAGIGLEDPENYWAETPYALHKHIHTSDYFALVRELLQQGWDGGGAEGSARVRLVLLGMKEALETNVMAAPDDVNRF